MLKRKAKKEKVNKKLGKKDPGTGRSEADDDVLVLQEVAETVEELERRHVDKPGRGLKGSREDLKKKPPEKLRKKRRRRGISKKKQLRHLLYMLALFLLTSAIAVFLMHEHYVTYTGVLQRDSISLIGRGDDYIAFRWDKTRNTEKYEVYCKEYVRDNAKDQDEESIEAHTDESWKKITTEGSEARFGDLKEASYYAFVIRPVNKHMYGKFTKPRVFSTKRKQKLKVEKNMTKLTVSEPFTIDTGAKTKVEFSSSDPEVAAVDSKTGKIVPKSAGFTDITVKARETDQFSGASSVVELEVIDSVSVPAGGAAATNIYHLSPDNCELVKTVEGSGGAVVPQGFGYTGDEYIVVFGMGSPNRIVSYDVEGDGWDVSTPAIDLGKPNGFAYADENGTCYCVKGWSSRAVTYKPETGEYDAVSLPYGCSGIGYDRKEKLLYTSSRTSMVAYDISDGYSIKYRTGVVSHSGKLYTQDCGGHGGILLRCLSGSNKHGTNYIDLYDMKHGNYLGTISCDLSEVESVIVNKDGYMEILSNNTGNADYIWRTDINIDTISEGLPE